MVILYPNTPLGSDLAKGILFNAYFQMYGELLLEKLEGTVLYCHLQYLSVNYKVESFVEASGVRFQTF